MNLSLRIACGVIAALVALAASAPAAADGARGLVRLLEGIEGSADPPAAPRVDTWTISQAVAWVNEQGDIALVLLTDDVDIGGFARSLDPSAWVQEQVGAAGRRHLSVGVYELPSGSYAHAYVGREVYTPASSGTLYGARIEAGRLRGRLVTIGGLRGSLYTDVEVDVPLWQVPAHRALPPDGGEPGAALRAFDAALKAGDRSAIRALLKPSLADELPDEAEFVRELADLRAYFGIDHRVREGVVAGDMAVLESTARGRGGEQTWRSVWLRSGERWLLDQMHFTNAPVLPQAHPPKAFIEVEPEPAVLADQPLIRLDEHTSMTLRHARAMALASGEHVVVLSDQPLSARSKAPASAAALSWSALSEAGSAKLLVIRLAAGGPAWSLNEIEHKAASARPGSFLVRGELTRIGTHLSGVLTTLRFPDAGGVETGESVLLDLEVEQPAAAGRAAVVRDGARPLGARAATTPARAPPTSGP